MDEPTHARGKSELFASPSKSPEFKASPINILNGSPRTMFEMKKKKKMKTKKFSEDFVKGENNSYSESDG